MTPALRRLLRDPLALTGLILLTVLGVAAAVGPLVAPHDPYAVDIQRRLLPPSAEHPLGTDGFGRDVLSRLLEGARVTLGTAAAVLAVAVAVGVPIGLVSGYVGGRLDAFFMRVVDGILAFPDVLLAIAVAGFFGPGPFNVLIAVAAVKWVTYARLVRGIVLAEREKEYVLAARVAGCTRLTILRKHLLPHVLPHVAVMATLDLAKIILLISSLSYIGLGAQPPVPEWGAMLNDGRPYFQTVPSLMVVPGLAIALAVLGCHLLGDGLRDALDVKQTDRTEGEGHGHRIAGSHAAVGAAPGAGA